MDEKKTRFWKHPVVFLGLVTLAATLVALTLWGLGYQVAGVAVGMAALLFWLILIIVATALVVSWWSATLMERGAQIALTAQVSDDHRDGQLLRTVMDLSKTWRQMQSDLPALPMPSQQDWRPPFEEGDFTDVN